MKKVKEKEKNRTGQDRIVDEKTKAEKKGTKHRYFLLSRVGGWSVTSTEFNGGVNYTEINRSTFTAYSELTTTTTGDLVLNSAETTAELSAAVQTLRLEN